MTDGDITAADGDITAGNSTDGKAANAIPEWFDSFAKTIDKRFEGLSAKLRDVAPKTTNGNGANDKPPVTAADIEAAYELGVVAAGLPDAAREHLQTMASQGASFSDRLSAARLIQQFSAAPARDAQSPAMAPIGKAASAAPRDAPTTPKTQAEWISLKRAAEKDVNARTRFTNLLHDENFDPNDLPVR